MKLPLAYFGNPILRKKAAPVEEINDEIKELVYQMNLAMQEHHGCGLAAPQVMRSIALFVTCIPQDNEETGVSIPGQLKVFINPKIISVSDEMWLCNEGCLSIPGIRGDVDRPFEVTVEASDLEGNRFTETFKEFDAHVILHENDHLNGVLYIDRLAPRIKKRIEPHLRAIKKKYSNS